MNVLIACEFSGVVREAFKDRGHNAWSCDLYDTEIDGQHLQMDIFKVLEKTEDKWDLMIAHPPCTYLCNSGVRWLWEDESRWKKMKDAVEFFGYLYSRDIPKIAIENPIPHKYALQELGIPYDQLIQPWWFGHYESKGTCLWLQGLKPLEPTKIVYSKKSGAHLKSGWVDRSRTYTGIANAMAEQWG